MKTKDPEVLLPLPEDGDYSKELEGYATECEVQRYKKCRAIAKRYPLKETQRKFVEYYLATASAADAAEAAGFSRSNGYQLLKNPNIKMAIEEFAQQDELVMHREERMRWWSAVARGMVPQADMRARLQASQFLAKVSGDFEDRPLVQIANINNNTSGPNIDVSKLSTEQLEQLEKIMKAASDD